MRAFGYRRAVWRSMSARASGSSKSLAASWRCASMAASSGMLLGVRVHAGAVLRPAHVGGALDVHVVDLAAAAAPLARCAQAAHLHEADGIDVAAVDLRGVARIADR